MSILADKLQVQDDTEKVTQDVLQQIASLGPVPVEPERLRATTTDGKAMEAALNRINGSLQQILFAMKRA